MILTKNGNLLKFVSGAAMNAIIPPDPLNPLGLPPFTIRCKFASGYTPSMGDSQTLVDAEENVWDIYKDSTDWTRLFYGNSNITEVLGANTTNVTNMAEMFHTCFNLNTVSLFDTSACTNMANMFLSSFNLRLVPLFDTSSCTDMSSMFNGCSMVRSGALALYQQASTQTNVPSHIQTFADCGSYTTTGAAELAQIPSDWK